MSRPELDPDLAAALEVLERAFGDGGEPPRVLKVHPTPPPPPAPAPVAAGATQPSLLDPDPEPPPAAGPLSHVPPSRRWRLVLRHASAPTRSPAPPTWRSGSR